MGITQFLGVQVGRRWTQREDPGNGSLKVKVADEDGFLGKTDKKDHRQGKKGAKGETYCYEKLGFLVVLFKHKWTVC